MSIIIYQEHCEFLEKENERLGKCIEVALEVLEFLWKIILSDEKSDVYESTLMRRICGLLYLPDKLSGDIKLKILNEKKIK